MISQLQLDIIVKTTVILTNDDYWKKQLWKRRKRTKEKYKDYTADEINVAFLSYRLETVGIYTKPSDSAWSKQLKTKEELKNYFDEFDELFKDYTCWLMENIDKYEKLMNIRKKAKWENE